MRIIWKYLENIEISNMCIFFVLFIYMFYDCGVIATGTLYSVQENEFFYSFAYYFRTKPISTSIRNSVTRSGVCESASWDETYE